jgi:hypothetical protein
MSFTRSRAHSSRRRPDPYRVFPPSALTRRSCWPGPRAPRPSTRQREVNVGGAGARGRRSMAREHRALAHTGTRWRKALAGESKRWRRAIPDDPETALFRVRRSHEGVADDV